MFSSLRSSNGPARGDAPLDPGSAPASLPSVATAEATPAAPLPSVESAAADEPADRKGRRGKSRGGRPRSADPREPRGIRFSSGEWAAIADRAAAAGRDPHTFVRDAALGTRLAPPPSAANREQWSRLAGLAANLNQITAAVQAGRLAAVGDGTAQLLADLADEVRALRLALLGIEPDPPAEGS